MLATAGCSTGGRAISPGIPQYGAGTDDKGVCAASRSHEEETQWTQCVVDYFAAAGCGNLTATEIANNCGSPINSNSSICPASPSRRSLTGADS